MVDQPAGIDVREIGQCPQNLPMQLDPANGGQGVLDRTSEEFVPERHSVAGGHQHPGRDADLHRLRRTEIKEGSARVGTTETSWASSRAGGGKARMRSRIRSWTAPGSGPRP